MIKRMPWIHACCSLSLLFALGACRKSNSRSDPAPGSGSGTVSGTGSPTPVQISLAEQYFQKSSTLALEVWYEAAAEPYTKSNFADRDYWNIVRENLKAIMQYRSAPPALTVPSQLSEMNLLSISRQENWTSAQLVALAAAHNKGAAPSGTSTFLVYFLDGYFNSGEGSNKNVIGVSLGGTNILAMFKPVIKSTSSGLTDLVPKFVEQSTLVHEMGHALGFVNNGVPMVTDYQDKEHGAHSNNEDDVMYWLNEGASDLQKFVVKYFDAQSVVMWGPEVLSDAKAISK